jgi:LacI family transcriptional regulator
MAAEHLFKCGFKHFAFCGSADSALEHTPWSEKRMASFRRRVTEAGFAPPPRYILSLSERDWPKERRKLATWLAGLPHPTGVMACNDDCGVQVMEACKLAGLAVPDVIGVVGVDNDEVVCGLSDPPMTSVAVNFERAGYESARALEKLMRGSGNSGKVPAKINVRATHIVARRSTDIISIEDRRIARAMNFIRGHAKLPISVNQVVRETGVSRRALERRFRREMGGSILSEIRRARIDQIAQMLLETDLSVGQIATSLGFEDVQHFARYFRSVKKMSPLGFRKTYGRWPSGAVS